MRDIPLLMVAQELNLRPAIDTRAIRIVVSTVAFLYILFMLTPVFNDDRAAAAHACIPLKCFAEVTLGVLVF